MARQSALSVFLENGTTEQQLAEIYGAVIENFGLLPVSMLLKNQQWSGNPESGSVEFKRFENAVSQAYGTARTAGKGVNVKGKPITVNIDVDREIIEEISKKDVDAYGVPAILVRRAVNHPETMADDADVAFFEEAWNAGTKLTVTSTDTSGQIEELIVKLATVQNDYVRGVRRDQMALVLTEALASALRLEIDLLPATDNAVAVGLYGRFHGVDVYTSQKMPDGVDAVIMVYGAIAQPFLIKDQYEAYRLQQSNDWSVDLFYSYGTQALTEDLIFYLGDEPSGS